MSSKALVHDTARGEPKPRDWDEIGIGSLVLAVDEDYGWFESRVVGTNGDAFTLKFRDYPGEPTFVRRRNQLALLPPDQG